MMKKDAVFFDFDGVILDSVEVKTRAFAKMFEVYGPEIERKVVDYHLQHGGISRFEKIRHYYENFLHKPVSEKELASLGEEFSRIAFTGVIESEFIDGALETLSFLRKRNILSFVVSGTPQEEMEKIVKIKEISRYFEGIHGSPRKKSEITLDLITCFSLKKEKCLFVGDAMTDYNAASVVGVDFLGVVPDGGVSPFPEGTHLCTSLTILQELI